MAWHNGTPVQSIQRNNLFANTEDITADDKGIEFWLPQVGALWMIALVSSSNASILRTGGVIVILS